MRRGASISLIAMAMALAMSAPANAEVYRWRDANGQLHFGDRPPPDAQTEQVEIRVNTLSGPPVVDTAAGLPPGVGSDGRVVLYGTSWCKACDQARAYLDRNGISYTEYDVETHPTGKRHFRMMKGTGVPILIVGGQRMSGFSARRFEALLAENAAD